DVVQRGSPPVDERTDHALAVRLERLHERVAHRIHPLDEPRSVLDVGLDAEQIPESAIGCPVLVSERHVMESGDPPSRPATARTSSTSASCSPASRQMPGAVWGNQAAIERADASARSSSSWIAPYAKTAM